MSGAVAFAYAGARAQARYGQLLGEAQWERLSRVPGFARFVQSARDTALRPWVVNFDGSTGAHAIESALRSQFRVRARAASAWAPALWRPALRWLETLPDVPVARHVLDGGETYAWIAGDPVLARGAGMVLGRAHAAGQPLVMAWLDHWRALWPEDGAARAPLERLIGLARSASQMAPREDAMAALARLQPALRRIFRRDTRAPAGLVAYVALSGLELLRLRGALLRRRFGFAPEVAAA